jgi:hypothetical protein
VASLGRLAQIVGLRFDFMRPQVGLQIGLAPSLGGTFCLQIGLAPSLGGKEGANE